MLQDVGHLYSFTVNDTRMCRYLQSHVLAEAVINTNLLMQYAAYRDAAKLGSCHLTLQCGTGLLKL